MPEFFRCLRPEPLMSLRPESWLQWAVFCTNQERKNHDYATKSLQLKKESHRIILVILYLFWGLPWKSESQATSLSIFTKWLLLSSSDKPSTHKRQGLCLSQNPEARPGTNTQSQAKFTCLGRPGHVWPTDYTELKSRPETQTFDVTLGEASHHAWISVRL